MSARCLKQGAAAQEWTARAAVFCLTRQRLAETRLHGPRTFCRPMQARRRVWAAANQPDSFDSTAIKDLNDFLLSTFPAKDPLREKPNRRLRHPVLSTAVGSINKPDFDDRIVCYRLANRFFTLNKGSGESRVTFARRRAALVVWVVTTGAIIVFNTAGSKELYLLLTGGQYPLTCSACPY